MKEPTEEMRERATAICTKHYGRWSTGLDADIAQALAAQDRLAVERCAKWHDEQADNWLLQSHKELGGPERFECSNPAIAVFIFSVTNEVAK